MHFSRHNSFSYNIIPVLSKNFIAQTFHSVRQAYVDNKVPLALKRELCIVLPKDDDKRKHKEVLQARKTISLPFPLPALDSTFVSDYSIPFNLYHVHEFPGCW